MYKRAIEQLFQRYLTAFHQQNMLDMRSCYQLPCILHTPDKVELMADNNSFEQAFLDIFTVLSHAQIKRFIALKASFSVLSEHLLIACVDWQFIDAKGDVFTDFSAFYHIALNDEQWQIFNVVSQELSQSITLNDTFDIIDKTPY